LVRCNILNKQYFNYFFLGSLQLLDLTHGYKNKEIYGQFFYVCKQIKIFT